MQKNKYLKYQQISFLTESVGEEILSINEIMINKINYYCVIFKNNTFSIFFASSLDHKICDVKITEKHIFQKYDDYFRITEYFNLINIEQLTNDKLEYEVDTSYKNKINAEYDKKWKFYGT